MIRLLLILLILHIATFVYADDIKWDESSIVKTDVNCDGKPDTAKLGYFKNRVRLIVTFGDNGSSSQFIEFGLGQSAYQDSLCGIKAILSIESMNYDLTEVFGENPEGFKQSKTCMGLIVSAGECDYMHIFWNHKKDHINWWRL